MLLQVEELVEVGVDCGLECGVIKWYMYVVSSMYCCGRPVVVDGVMCVAL